MKLYFAPRTRSVRPRWLLEELEVPYELVKVEPTKAAYPAFHAAGELPVLVDGEVTLFESTAICLYLADRFPEKRLAPTPGSAERASYLQWLLFAEVTLDPLVVEHLRNVQSPTGARSEPASKSARLDALLDAVDARLEGREFLAGEAFTAADVVMASLLHLANVLALLDRHPRLVEYVRRHTRRPASVRAVFG